MQATQLSTGRIRETVTSEAGLFSFPNLEVGQYKLTVEQPGFKKLERENIVITTATQSVVDLKIEVGDVSQTVTVTAEQPLLATATSEIGTTFLPKLFKDTPIFVGGGLRNPESFVSYMPGVNNGSGDSSINGGNRRAKEILIDGAGTTNPESGGVAFDFPTVEAFGEFKLVVNNFAAEYGRTGGGIEIFTTASGGNRFHGSVFDYHRNSALDSTAWATNANPNPALRVKPKYRQNEYGFAVGGPIYMPKKIFGPVGGYNENRTKTFFFFTYNGYRQNKAASPSTITVPTLAQRRGDFSGLVNASGQQIPIFDPVTQQQFPGNIIPSNRFSAVSKAILPFYPDPQSSALVNNYTGNLVTDSRQNSWSLKIDQSITEKHRISGWLNYIDKIVHTAGPLPDPVVLGRNTTEDGFQKPQFYRFNYDFTISPTMNLHATYGITRFRQLWDGSAVGEGWAGKLGLKGVAVNSSDSFPVVSFGGRYFALADTNGNKTKGSQFNFTDHIRVDLSWIKGSHNMKFGFDKRWMRTTGELLPTGAFDDAGVQGEFRFSNLQTANPAAAGTTGDAFASFLLGLPNYASRQINVPGASATAKFGYNALYAQTDWKVRPRLTLNLGFRYEIPIPRITEPDNFTSFDPNVINPSAGGLKGGILYAGEGAGRTGSRSFGKTDYSSYGPRIGFAYSINDKTVVRGGYGIYYGAGNGLTGGFCLGCSFGFSAKPEFESGQALNPAIRWDDGFPTSGYALPPFISPDFANKQAPWYISPDSGKAPRIQNFNLNIQREIWKKFLVDVAYVGSRGTRLSWPRDPFNVLDPKYFNLSNVNGVNLLNLEIDDPRVVAAGFAPPYANFIFDWRTSLKRTTGATLAQALRPFPQFGNIFNDYNPKGRSWYDSVQIKVERRFGSLTLLSSYVFSKSLTDASGTQTSSNGLNLNPRSQNPYNDSTEKTFLYTDWPHVFNAIWSWDLPFGKGKRFLGSGGISHRVFGGWTIAAAHQYRSGTLLLINAAGVPPTYERKNPNLSGQSIKTGISYDKLDPNDPNTRWINRAAFSVPDTYAFGNSANFLADFRTPPV